MRSMPVMEKYRENLSTDLCIRLLGGGAAGVTAASITYPLDLVRTRLAAQVILLESWINSNAAVPFFCVTCDLS